MDCKHIDYRSYNVLSKISVNQILIYLRKSRQDNPMETVEQVLSRHEMQLQDFALRTFGAHIPAENIYREIVSGETIEDRPEMCKVMERIHSNNIRAVLVIEPQRLTRGDLLDLGTIVHALRYTQTLCITPGKTFNLDDKYDRRQFEDELKRGNDYLEYIKEILDRGRRASVMQGYWVSPFSPFGYSKEMQKNKKFILVQDENAKHVRMIFEMYAEGVGRQKIAQELERLSVPTPFGARKWQRNTIFYILTNDVYIGWIHYGEYSTIRTYVNGKLVKRSIKAPEEKAIRAKGLHAPIISDELWARVQSIVGKTNKAKTSTELTNVFAGLLFCKRCGYCMTYRKNKMYKVNRYGCSMSRQCDNASASVNEIIGAVKSALEKSVEDVQVKISSGEAGKRERHMEQLQRLEAKKEKLKERESVLYDLLENGTYSAEEFSVRRAKLRQEMDDTQQAIETTAKTIPQAVDYHDAVIRLQAAIRAIDDERVPVLEKNNLLKSIIDRIEYERERPEKQGVYTPFTVEVFLRL